MAQRDKAAEPRRTSSSWMATPAQRSHASFFGIAAFFDPGSTAAGAGRPQARSTL